MGGSPQNPSVCSTLAGTGLMGNQDGVPKRAQFNFPFGVAADDTGIYISDYSNSAIRKIQILLPWTPGKKK